MADPRHLFGNTHHDVFRARALEDALDRMGASLRTICNQLEAAHDEPPALVVRSVSHSYDGWEHSVVLVYEVMSLVECSGRNQPKEQA